MPRQNRVTPFGQVIAVPERGTLMGNRGCLHDADGRIRRPYVGKRWIACVLQFKGRRRRVMAPGRYTELFFLDEATALAAGHRPCAECQRERHLAFRRHWMAARGWTARVGVDGLDGVLHAERLDDGGRQRADAEPWATLPDGAMVAAADAAYLIHRGGLLRWSPGGYAPASPPPPAEALRALTPPSIVAAIRDGYRVQTHVSALSIQTAGGSVRDGRA